MPLFFMLSGYVHGMRQRQAGTTDFLHGLRQNFIALYVPCMFFSFLQAFLNLIVFSRSNAANVHIPELRHFMMIPFNGFLNYWFLCALFLVKSIHMAFESAGANEHLHSFFLGFIVRSFLDCRGQYASFPLPAVLQQPVLQDRLHSEPPRIHHRNEKPRSFLGACTSWVWDCVFTRVLFRRCGRLLH